MAQILVPKIFHIPLWIGKMIAKRNEKCSFQDLGGGTFSVEGSSIIIWKYWFTQTIPYPWGEAVWKYINSCGDSTYFKFSNNVSIFSDLPISYANLPLPSYLFSILEETSVYYKISIEEVILGILCQFYKEWIKNDK